MRLPFFSAIAAAAATLLTSLPGVAQENAGGLYPGVMSSLIAPARNVPVGAPAHGLAAALDASPSTVRAGQPVVLSLELRNVSKQMQLLYRPEMPCGYSFVVTNLRSGRSTTVAPSGCGDLLGSPIDGLNAGESEFLKFKFFDKAIAEPAHYRISLASITWYPNSSAEAQTLKVGSTAVDIAVSP